MTMARIVPFVLLALGLAFSQTGTQAGDKDKKDKDKAVELKFKEGVASVDTTLNAKDPLYKEEKPHKPFVVALEEGKTYQIDMIAKDQQKLDCYLFLLGPDGKVVASDDDGGDGLNSQIIHKADKAGKYRIVCTHFGVKGEGDFTLTVKISASN